MVILGWALEYQANERMTLRTGFGYEISPITDQVRTPLIPDADRFWASIGASYVIIKGLKADVAYSHVYEPNASINITRRPPAIHGLRRRLRPSTRSVLAISATLRSHADIISIGVNWKWDEIFK